MLTSNDGYCSVAVYDKGELGIPYEGEPVFTATMDNFSVPESISHATKSHSEPFRPLTVLDTWARKSEPTPPASIEINRDNKRRITPTLVETKPAEDEAQQKKKRRIAPTLISSL